MITTNDNITLHYYTNIGGVTITALNFYRSIFIDSTSTGFLVYTEGGPMKSFKSLGKAVTFAEKTLVSMVRNNDLA